MENQKFQHQFIMKFLVLEGQSPSNIHERITSVYGDNTPSRTLVFEWVRPFNNRQLNIEARRRSAGSITATNETNSKTCSLKTVELLFRK